MKPVDNQPARLCGIHKFDNISDITSASIKFWPIIDQTAFYMHNAAQVISDYLFFFLRKNVYTTTDTQTFPQHLSNLPPLQDDEEDASYDFKSLYQKHASFENNRLYFSTNI